MSICLGSNPKTIDRLENILKEKGLTIFKIVNHRECAGSVNVDLPPSVVVIFGNPKLGTPLMQCVPTTAIDLPKKCSFERMRMETYTWDITRPTT